MCTLIVFKDMHSRHPLVVAANRDEVPTRPSEPPAEIGRGIFAPRDAVHGGSWIGVNHHGLVAALTNRSWVPRHKGRRSRGLIVTEALAEPSLERAYRSVMSAVPGTYNGFQLFLANGVDAMIIWSDGGAIESKPLADGLHVLTGQGCWPGHSDRDRRVRGMVAYPARIHDPEWLDALLSFHGSGPESGTCAHGEGVRMESVSSMTIHLPSSGYRRFRLRWRDGRPCRSGPWSETEIFIDEKERP